MKLGISYSVFDGEELLEASLKCMRPHAYHIVVVYQTVSYTGNPASQTLLPLLHDLKERQWIDTLLYYPTHPNRSPSGEERRKRNVGLRHIAGVHHQACTHYMTMDTDEFYLPEAFDAAKVAFLEGGYDASVCPMVDYFKSPRVQLAPFEQHQDYYVPCISALPVKNTLARSLVGYPFWGTHRHGKQKHYPVLSDTTRQVPYQRMKIFKREELVMHHMSLVRKDIKSKFLNSSAQTILKTLPASHLERYEAYYQAWQPPQTIHTPYDTAFAVGYPYTVLPDDPFGIAF
jgi:hypothetical protein